MPNSNPTVNWTGGEYLPRSDQDTSITAPIDTYVNAPATPTAPMPNPGVSNQLQQLYQPTQPMPWDGMYSKSIIWNGGGGYTPPPVSPSDTPPPTVGGGTSAPPPAPVAPAPNGNPAGPMSVPSAAYPMAGSRLIPGMSAYNIGYPGGNVPDAVGGAPQAGVTAGNYHPPYPSGTSDPSQYPAMAQAMTNYWAAQNYPQAQTTDPSQPYYVDQNGMIHVIPGYAKGGQQTVPAGTYITDDGVPLFRAGEKGPEKIEITPSGGKKKKKGKAAPEPTTPNTPPGQAPGWFYQQFVLPMLSGQQPGANPAQAGAPGDPGFPAMDNNATPNDGPSAMLQGQLLPNFDPSGAQNQYTNFQGDQFPKQPLAPFDPKAYGGAVTANPQGGNAALPQGSLPLSAQIRQYDDGGEIYANQNYGQNQNGWDGNPGQGTNSTFFFTGNSNNGGTFTNPGSNYAIPQSNYGTMNPTYQATQLTNQFNANFNPNWSAQGAMNYWNGIQPLYNQVAQNPYSFPQAFQQSTQMANNTPMYTPPPMQTMNPGSSGPQMNAAGVGVPLPSYVAPASSQPQGSNQAQAQTANESMLTDPTQQPNSIKPPDVGSGGLKTSDPNAVGPNGRSFDQIKGTPYQSPEEREWYLNQIGQTVDPRTGAPIALPQQATQPAQQSAPVSPQGRTVQQMAGTPYQSQEERDWYLQQIGQSPKPQAPQAPQQQQPQNNVQQQQPGVPPEVAQAAQARGIPNWSPQIAALMNHEGNGATDPASGARWGILPSTAATYGVHDMSQLTSAKAADIAAQYLATNSSMFHGNQAQTFASYFIGAGNVLNAINQGGNWEQNANHIAANYGYGGNAMTGFLNYLGVQR